MPVTQSIPRKKKSVLLVEPDRLTQQMVQRAAARQHISVVTAAGANDGINFLKKRCDR